MYVLRTQRWRGKDDPSGKPDGMFVRADGRFTEDKISAKVFETRLEATWFITNWYATVDGHGYTCDGQELPLFLVEVEVRPVVQKVLGLIEAFHPDRSLAPK